MLASRNRSPEPDLTAAFTIANFYHLGLRGVKQDLRLALKYYEICGDYNHWEGGGLAGLFHVWGIGMKPEERDLGKALSYFQQGTPGGIEGCASRMKHVCEACVFAIFCTHVSYDG
jgi:TPR repeat protein